MPVTEGWLKLNTDDDVYLTWWLSEEYGDGSVCLDYTMYGRSTSGSVYDIDGGQMDIDITDMSLSAILRDLVEFATESSVNFWRIKKPLWAQDL